MPELPDITRMLKDVDDGDAGAMDELMDAVYGDLQRMAEKHMGQRFGRDLPGVTLEPAALVNESFMKLIKQRTTYDSRGHFFAIATKVMLRVLVDYQRSRLAVKRGGGRKPLTLSLDAPAGDDGDDGSATTEIAVDSLVDALSRLEALDARKADVVKLRVVWGLQMPEIATSLAISLATVERDWSFAKAWLARESARALCADEEPT